ncbi:MAG: hypothetical protein WCW66_00475 [Patescibacteria group bacterium]
MNILTVGAIIVVLFLVGIVTRIIWQNFKGMTPTEQDEFLREASNISNNSTL